MPRPRLRFSLLTVLLVTTIVGMAIVVVMQWRSLAPLRAEVRRLRNEVGDLSVDDPTKLCAIQVNTHDELTWKWRVWVPQGKVYRVREYGGEVPKEGYPEDGGTVWLREPGEHVVEYRIIRDPRDDQWYGWLQTRSGGVGKDAQPWVKWPSRRSSTGGVGTTTQSFEPDRRVELIRHRVSQAGHNVPFEDPAAGFMVWLEPEPVIPVSPASGSSNGNGDREREAEP